MIDGFKFRAILPFPLSTWEDRTKIDLKFSVNQATGEVETKRLEDRTVTTCRAKWQNLNLEIKTVEFYEKGSDAISYLNVRGSLHKFYCNGSNSSRFDFSQICAAVDSLSHQLKIHPSEMVLENLEFGVNVTAPYPVYEYHNMRLLSFKGTPFTHLGRKGYNQDIGHHADFSQYVMKLYCKGITGSNLLRFEIRAIKMKYIAKSGIKTLEDLKSVAKLNILSGLLTKNWNDILFNELPPLNDIELKPSERRIIESLSSNHFAKSLNDSNPRRYNYERKVFRKLNAANGNGNSFMIAESIKSELSEMLNCPILPTLPNIKLSDFTVKINGNNNKLVNANSIRTCKSCGRDISNQKEGSRYCSEKSVGYAAAHKCRNKNSNERNSLIRRIDKIKASGLLFDITPFLSISDHLRPLVENRLDG